MDVPQSEEPQDQKSHQKTFSGQGFTFNTQGEATIGGVTS